MIPSALEPRTGRNRRIALIVSRFNEFISVRLLEGARDALLGRGFPSENLPEFWVPGAFELPLVAQELARSEKFDAILCLGAVIRGDTPHFDYVCAECARGIADVSRAARLPVLFGVLTTDNVEQAEARAGGRLGNKGSECALAALAAMDVLTRVRELA